MPSVAGTAKDGLIFSRPATNGTPRANVRIACQVHKSEGPAASHFHFWGTSNIFITMFYVYLLRSQSSPDQVYTGFTEDLRQRLEDHNAGKSTHTKKCRPWRVETYLAFSERLQALDFERYLKTASGIAFANKRLRNR